MGYSDRLERSSTSLSNIKKNAILRETVHSLCHISVALKKVCSFKGKSLYNFESYNIYTELYSALIIKKISTSTNQSLQEHVTTYSKVNVISEASSRFLRYFIKLRWRAEAFQLLLLNVGTFLATGNAEVYFWTWLSTRFVHIDTE